MIYERNYRSKCTVIYTIKSKVDEIDKILTETSIRKYTRYVLFKNTNLETRIEYLHTNNCSNTNGKFKILFNSNVNKLIKVGEEKWVFLKDYLLDITDENNNQIFLGVE